MKKLLLGITAITILSVAFTSCSIEKRVYQSGYHLSWKHRHSILPETTQTHEINSAEEATVQSNTEITEPNVHSVETISANSIQDNELILSPKKSVILKSKNDTIVPDQQQDEYFSNNYTNPLPTNELQDIKLANWALGLGIGALTSPAWLTLLFFLIFFLTGATWSSGGALAALVLAILVGGGIFIALEVLAITFAIRFLTLHGKDPNYRKYRGRAIAGLILAGIYPALILLNLMLSIALI